MKLLYFGVPVKVIVSRGEIPVAFVEYKHIDHEPVTAWAAIITGEHAGKKINARIVYQLDDEGILRVTHIEAELPEHPLASHRVTHAEGDISVTILYEPDTSQ